MRARQRGAEADQVRAALDRVDVVREAVDALVVGLVVLDRDLDRDRHLARALRVKLALAGDEDRRLVQRRAAPVQVLDEGDDAALVAEVVGSCRCARPRSGCGCRRSGTRARAGAARARRRRTRCDGKISESGWKVTCVPVRSVVPIAWSGALGLAAPVALLPDLARRAGSRARAARRARSPPRRRRRGGRPRPCRSPR